MKLQISSQFRPNRPDVAQKEAMLKVVYKERYFVENQKISPFQAQDNSNGNDQLPWVDNDYRR